MQSLCILVTHIYVRICQSSLMKMPFPRCLWVANLGELLVFLISVAVVFSRSCSIWGGGGADTFVSSCPTHADWSIYLPSGAENAVSVNDAIFVPAG